VKSDAQEFHWEEADYNCSSGTNKASTWGTLVFYDRAFCLQIYEVLINNRGKSIQQIGAIDLSRQLERLNR
jgi:hypothetical protein